MHADDPTRVLITGAGGFVGPYLEDHCSLSGDVVQGIDLHNGPDLLDLAGWVDFLQANPTDTVYHLAGFSDVGRSWDVPAVAFQVNATGTLHVLEAARQTGVKRVVLISSADVYGVVKPTDLPLTELSPAQPSSPYGASKLAAEAIGQQYVRGWGLDVIIARPFNHIGPGQSPNFVTSAFADRVATSERDGGGDVRHGDLTPERDFTDVRDVVRAYRLMAHHGTPGEIYNVCSGRAVAMSEVLSELIAQVDVDVTTSVDPALIRPVELPVLRGSHDKLSQQTGWQPEVALATSIADVLGDARERLINPPS